MASDTIRYGVIGTGMMGLEHIANIAALDGAAVTAVADPSELQRKLGSEMAGGVPGFATHTELLHSGLCDAVVVVAPNYLHRDILIDAAAADVHVLTEKPMCITVEQCREVIAAAAGSRKVHWVGLEYRYMPPIAALLDQLEVVGSVKMIAIREHRFPFLEKVASWNRFTEYTGGTLVEKCCHFFDLMNLVAGAHPVRVMASGAQDVNHIFGQFGIRRFQGVNRGFDQVPDGILTVSIGNPPGVSTPFYLGDDQLLGLFVDDVEGQLHYRLKGGIVVVGALAPAL